MTPRDVRELPREELASLAENVRRRIISVVSENGGHLSASLGAVELAIGLLRTFDPEVDKVLWDVGHQAYAWKILTGRDEAFGTLRRHHGISGFPNPKESPYDAFIAGHAGSALGAAVGLAAARDRLGGGHVVVVVGDASLANAGSLEALNCCTSLAQKVIVVVNDNAMSISKNVGAFARTLGRLLSDVRYNRAKAVAERAGHRMRLTFLRSLYHRVEQVVKSLWLRNSLFESLGLRYIGPVDGHDLAAVTSALIRRHGTEWGRSMSRRPCQRLPPPVYAMAGRRRMTMTGDRAGWRGTRRSGMRCFGSRKRTNGCALSLRR